MISFCDTIRVRTMPSAALPQTCPLGNLSFRGDFLLTLAKIWYNLVNRFGLVRYDDCVKRDRNLPHVGTNGNKTAGCGQCPTFAWGCAGKSRDTALYSRGERDGTTVDPDRDSPTRSCDRDTTKPGNACLRPGGAYTERWNAAESATPVAQRSTARHELTLRALEWVHTPLNSTSGLMPRYGRVLLMEET